MKNFFKGILVIIGIIALVEIVSFLTLEVSDEKLSGYSQYYFSKLQLDEKKIYVKIDEAIKSGKGKATVKVRETTGLTEKINKVVTAYFYDNPEYYYVSNEYIIATKDFKLLKYCDIEFDYLIDIDTELAIKNKELEIAMDNLLNEVIKEGMSDFEKEVAIHDAIIDRVSYYEYEDINKIPAIKHTAYGALVDKEAVCDGYSKAFKMLLEKVGINNIIVSGETNNVAHAWNMVSLEGKYYHVDVTSDKIQEKNNRYAAHSYFNVTDEEILETHSISRSYIYPECNSEVYDYYTLKDYYISNEDNLYNKLYDIVSRQQASNILEIKVDRGYSVQHIIDALYDVNFNNWRSRGQTSVTYSKIEDVYVFVK